MVFNQRSYQNELMDDLSIDKDELFDTLAELNTINKYLGGYQTSIDGVMNLVPPECKSVYLLDVATGGGELLPLLAEKFDKQNILFSAVGVDINQNCIEYARAFETEAVKYAIEDVFDTLQQKTFDIIHAGLFLHHLKDQQIIQLVKLMKDRSRFGVVINDLHRHWFAYYSIKSLTNIFSRSRLIRHDAPLSVLRAFSMKELSHYIDEAGWQKAEIDWRWAFRWLTVLRH